MHRYAASLLAVLLALTGAAAAQAPAVKPDRVAFAKSVCSAIDVAAGTHSIDRVFFARLLWKESLFDPNAVSPVGAQGIAQFMPGTAERRNLADPFEPLAAVKASASFLSDLKKEFGNLGLAAAAYNAGEQRIHDWLDGKRLLPAETEDYVAYITGQAADAWRSPSASHAIPAISKDGDFSAQCVALASREVSLPGGTRLARLQPWGVLLASAFSEGKALAMYRRLKLRFPRLLEGKTPMVARKRNLSRGTKRMALVMLGAPTREAATQICKNLTEGGMACVVRKSR